MPGMRWSDSARFWSGNLAMSSATIASTDATASRLRLSAALERLAETGDDDVGGGFLGLRVVARRGGRRRLRRGRRVRRACRRRMRWRAAAGQAPARRPIPPGSNGSRGVTAVASVVHHSLPCGVPADDTGYESRCGESLRTRCPILSTAVGFRAALAVVTRSLVTGVNYMHRRMDDVNTCRNADIGSCCPTARYRAGCRECARTARAASGADRSRRGCAASKIIVARFARSYCGQAGRPGWLGLPVVREGDEAVLHRLRRRARIGAGARSAIPARRACRTPAGCPSCGTRRGAGRCARRNRPDRPRPARRRGRAPRPRSPARASSAPRWSRRRRRRSGVHVGIVRAIFGDDPFGQHVDAQLGRHPLGEIVPAQPLHLVGLSGEMNAPRLVVRVAQDHRDRQARCGLASGQNGWRTSHFMSSTGPK